MATKPMPRIRAGISGTPVITTGKRPVPSSSKPKDVRTPTKQVTASLTKEKSTKDLKPTFSMVCSVKNQHNPSEKIDAVKQRNKDAASVNKSLTSWEKLAMEFNYDPNSPEVEQNTLSTARPDNPSVNNAETESDVFHLKRLLMLQVSLIGRQQDLLKLRDKEILQLKSTRQSYKSRLERMERRISLSRRQSDSRNVTSNLHKTFKPNQCSEVFEDDDFLMDTSENEEKGTASQHFDTNNHENFVYHKTKRMNSSVSMHPESSNASAAHKNDNLKTATTQTEFSSPVSTIQSAYTASGHIPIPVSYIERCNSQLSQAPHIDSETGILVRAVDSPQPIVIKTCERCPHCIAMVTEIKTAMPFSQISVSSDPSLIDKANLDKLTGTNLDFKSFPFKAAAEDHLQEQGDVAITTGYAYYRHNYLRDDDFYRFTDFDPSLGEDSSLNIPTWKTNKISSSTDSDQCTGDEIKEATDDDSFWKRHARLELSEKRRKRWDIQRIREFRYNEKLRQKQLKLGHEEESFETFAPSLHDLTAVEVQETIPINVFGHLLVPLKPEEFSLPADL